MKKISPALHDDLDDLGGDTEEAEQARGPMEEEPDYLLPGPRVEPRETEVLADWRRPKQGVLAGSALIDWRSLQPRNSNKFDLIEWSTC